MFFVDFFVSGATGVAVAPLLRPRNLFFLPSRVKYKSTRFVKLRRAEAMEDFDILPFLSFFLPLFSFLFSVHVSSDTESFKACPLPPIA